MLALFVRKELVDQARVNMLKDWKNSGFSIESETRLFSKADRKALGQYVVRGATCADKIQYDPASDTVIWTASPKGFYKGKTKPLKGLSLLNSLWPICHYGGCNWFFSMGLMLEKFASSGKSDRIFTAWHQRVGKKTTQASPKLFKQNRQRMPHPFICPKCQGSMSVVAIITTGTWCCRVEWILVCAYAHGVIEDPNELGKIIEWTKLQERGPPVTACARAPPERALGKSAESRLTAELYWHYSSDCRRCRKSMIVSVVRVRETVVVRKKKPNFDAKPQKSRNDSSSHLLKRPGFTEARFL